MEKMMIEVGHIDDMLYDAVGLLVKQGMNAYEICEVLGKSLRWFYKHNEYWGFELDKSNSYLKAGQRGSRKGKSILESKKDEIIQRRMNGESAEVVARDYGVSPRTVARLTRGHRILPPILLTDEQQMEIVRLYQSGGYTLRKLAVLFSVSTTTLRKVLAGEYRKEKEATHIV